MTDKIIIDGVDVTECCYITDENECEVYQTECEAQYCYYKQLQRKEQECGRYKQTLEDIKQETNQYENKNELYNRRLSKIHKIINKVLNDEV